MNKILTTLHKTPITTDYIVNVVQNFHKYKLDFAGDKIIDIDNDGISEFFFYAMISDMPSYLVASDYPNTNFKTNNDSGEDIVAYISKPPYLKIIEVKGVRVSTININSAVKKHIKTSLEKSFGNTETKINSVKSSRSSAYDVKKFESDNSLPDGTIFDGVSNYLSDIKKGMEYNDDIAETYILSPDHTIAPLIDIDITTTINPKGNTHTVYNFIRNDRDKIEVEYE